MSFDYVAIDTLKVKHDDLRDKVSKLIEFQLKHNNDFFKEFGDSDLNNIKFFEKNYVASLEKFLEMDDNDPEKKKEYDEIIRRIKLRTVLLDIQKGFYQVYLKDKDLPDNPHIDEMKLIDILKTVLMEASLQKDASEGKQASSYIRKMMDLINNYTKDTKEIQIKGVGSYSYVHIELDGFYVDFLPTDKGSRFGRFHPSVSGEKPNIEMYKSIIKLNQDGKKLQLFTFKKILYHELIHLLDYRNKKLDPHRIAPSYQKDREKKGFSGYINHGTELNAHFFEYFMSPIVKMIEKEREIPPTFEEFQKDLFKDPEVKGFMEELEEKNKRKVMKRLGTYYNDILKNPDFKIQNGDKIDNNRLEKATKGFAAKVKDFFKAA